MKKQFKLVLLFLSLSLVGCGNNNIDSQSTNNTISTDIQSNENANVNFEMSEAIAVSGNHELIPPYSKEELEEKSELIIKVVGSNKQPEVKKIEDVYGHITYYTIYYFDIINTIKGTENIDCAYFDGAIKDYVDENGVGIWIEDAALPLKEGEVAILYLIKFTGGYKLIRPDQGIELIKE